MASTALPDSNGKKPFRVFTVFAVGIILPAVFLIVLAVRSLRYEAIVMQKRTEEQYAAVGDLIQRKASDIFMGLSSDLARLTQDPSFKRFDVANMVPRVLAMDRLGTVPVAHAMVFDFQNQLVLPANPDGSGRELEHPADVEWGSFRDDISRLENLEFVQKDVGAAVAGYVALQSRSMSRQQQAALWKTIAGGYLKLHDDRTAEQWYLRIFRTFGDVTDVSGYPLAIVAAKQLDKIYGDRQMWDRAIDLDLDVYEGLVRRRWNADKQSANRMMGELKTTIPTEIALHGRNMQGRTERWARLERERSQLGTEWLTAESFTRTAWPDIVKRLREHGWFDRGGVLQLLGPDFGSYLAVVAPILDGDRRRGVLVALVPRDVVLQTASHLLDEQVRTLGISGAWDFSAKAFVGATSMWRISIERAVDSVDPPFHFRILASASGEQDQISHRRVLIYGGMLGLSIVVIIVGLFVMRQSVKREVELANLKADFVANVSHELRTPLTAIAHIGELLRRGRYRSELDRKEYYEMLGQETERLKDLVDDTLDFSKMLAGKKMYKQEAIELGSLVRGAYERFIGKANARGFTVGLETSEEDIEIIGDSAGLMHVVLNLLDNALKYSGDSKHIDVRVTKAGNSGVLEVQDYGIGIADAEHGRIFDKFYRVDQGKTAEAAGGVGLGLAMVKHTVEGHKATIAIKSRLGDGSTFILKFPLARRIA